MRVLLCFLLLLAPVWAQTGVVEEAVRVVRREFFDPNLRGVNWDELGRQAEVEERSARGWSDVSAVVNRLLSKLQTSHTRFFSPEETGYFEIMGIFAPLARGELQNWMRRTFPEGKPTYEGVGMAVGADNFITGVWDGFPAAQAGLTVGDRILEVDGRPFQPVLSFRGKAQVSCKVEYQPGQTRTVNVKVEPLDTTKCYQTAMERSARLIERKGKLLSYVHVWSYAGDAMHERLVELVTNELNQGEGLVLDLRDGWGGASPTYLNLFNQRVPHMEMIGRDGRVSSWDEQWKKPVVMLVNGGSRSGKEILAFAFQRYKIGPVIGSPTAGAVVGGRPYPLKRGGVLYLAVADVKVDGVRLEGNPVQPDVVVERTIPYCQGADPQLEKALEVLLERVK